MEAEWVESGWQERSRAPARESGDPRKGKSASGFYEYTRCLPWNRIEATVWSPSEIITDQTKERPSETRRTANLSGRSQIVIDHERMPARCTQ